MNLLTWIALSILVVTCTYGQDTTKIYPKKSYTTAYISQDQPLIDGIINEACWSSVDWGGDFIQLSPNEGEAPTHETNFKILYDDRFLYIAYRCHDDEPDKIVKRMSRRDGFSGDWVEVNIDSYNDDRTAFSFTISAAGVRSDEFVSNNGFNWDESWNPIWSGKSTVDSLGWAAEVKIPLSQIRYSPQEDKEWGIQFTRRDFRNESRSTWQFISQNDGNWVSNFGTLKGLESVKQQKQIEIQPYSTAAYESFPAEAGNPFADGNDAIFNVGVDGKIGVTSDLTLDFTINPDFGQVEADPGALRLDGYQVFFSERRPFFIENRNLFDYRFGWAEAGGPFNSDNLFYSRRIGRAPQSYPELGDDEYADVPRNTNIIGAAKFSGKTKNGTAIGILSSVTAKETAQIDFNGDRREEIVEPLTSYFVGRATQDFDEGKSVLGGIITLTNRSLDGTGLEDNLHKSALTGGIDFTHWWKDRTYFLTINGVFSHVTGTPQAIRNTQESFEHYFQRPGADHIEVDAERTSLTGSGGTVKVGRLNKPWKFETGVTYRSPEFEINDIGFLNNTDEINYFLWTGYRFTKQNKIWRWAQINYNHYAKWDFGGNNLYKAVNTNAHFFLNNFWRIGGGLTYDFKDISNNGLFGGPALRLSQGVAPWFYIQSDQRKMVQVWTNGFFARGFEKDEPQTVNVSSWSVGINIQPSDALRISLRPNIRKNQRKIQHVNTMDYGESVRYVAASVDQRTFSLTMRLNYSITPDLSIQYYGQPFISRGNYNDFKYITNSLARNFSGRVHQYSSEEIAYSNEDDEYYVDENADGMVDYHFGNPDFSFMQFRSNLVARWEYVPGSELFFVWTQSNTLSGDPMEELIPSITNTLFDQQPRNIFLVKWTYRFLL